MKRIPTLRLATIFIAILATMLTVFVSLCKQVRHEQQVEQQKFDEQWADMVDTNSVDNTKLLEWTDPAMDTIQSMAGVSVQDSVIFEYFASLATVVDLPEETPVYGDSCCAYVSHDTIFIQHWNKNINGNEHQRQMFRFIYGQ